MTPNLMVEDVNRTIEFYAEALGFELLTTVPEEGQFDWAMMKRDDQLKGRVEIVQDLHTTFYGTQEFAFKDCNGYIIGFSEAVDSQ